MYTSIHTHTHTHTHTNTHTSYDIYSIIYMICNTYMICIYNDMKEREREREDAVK
jgi:hypothetical protein